MTLKINHLQSVFLALVLFFLLQSCGSIKNDLTMPDVNKSNCNQQSDYQYSVDDLPKPTHTIVVDSNLTNKLSSRSIHIANSIGLLDEISDYIAVNEAYSKSPSLELKIEILDLKQQINDQINTSSLEVSSVTSELDCEEERTSQISNYLKAKMSDREKKFVIGSIIIGATGGIGSELLPEDKTGKAGMVVAIATSVVEATFGVLMLFNERKVDFYHNRNTPSEIWFGPAVSKTLPSSIWFYLNYNNLTINQKSLREQLVENWKSFGQIKKKKKNAEQSIPIYFGNGGEYTADELENRADMYDQIESYIALMKQDLKQLSNEVGQIRELK